MTRRPCTPAARCGLPALCGVCRLIAKDPAFAAGFAPRPAVPVWFDQPGRTVPIPAPPPVVFAPTKPRAVVTVAAGVEGRRLHAASGAHLRRYAAEADADLIVLDWPGLPGLGVTSKFQLSRVLDLGYEQVAHVDADTLCRPGAVDLFDLCPPDEFGILDELPWHHSGDGVVAAYHRFRARSGLAPLSPLPWYGNAGVMVFGQAHRAVLDPPAELWVEDSGIGRHCSEQNLTVARLHDGAGGVRVRLLPVAANLQSWTCRACGGEPFRAAPRDAIFHWSSGGGGGGGARTQRAADIAAWAARFPWP
ncbi:hypothetical protein J0H58_31710 [bacterium]|nr:hypothetical protein [bacterium]